MSTTSSLRRAALTLAAVSCAGAADAVEVPLVPRLELTAYTGGGTVDHPAGDPLMLIVALSNPLGSRIPQINAERAADGERYQQSETFRAMSAEEQARVRERYQPLEVPRFTLGSAARPAESLVRFVVRGFRGERLDVPVRALAGNSEERAVIEAADANAVALKFGIDADATSALEPGIYSIVAEIDTRNETGMWQGRVFSEPLTLHLTSEPEHPTRQSTNRRRFAVGRYLLADAQYDAAWTHATAMTDDDPGYVGGWWLLGEALDGRGELAEALVAFERAHSLSEEMLRLEPPAVPEPPEVLSRRIEEISARLAEGQ